MSQKEKLDACFKEGRLSGERHKGLRKIPESESTANNFLKKAQHNFEAIIDFKNFGYSDWSASAAFYSLYHLLLALLSKKGFESRNQSCTFALVGSMIENNEISLTKEELKEIFDKDITEDLIHSNKILDIREIMQYSAKTSMEDNEFNRLFDRTKFLFDKLRLEVENGRKSSR
jgi:uncharacterized protein (UPF0332 family)